MSHSELAITNVTAHEPICYDTPLLFLTELTNCHVGTSNTVFVLSPEDGRQDVVTMATNICHLVVQRQLRVEDIDPATVASKITGR